MQVLASVGGFIVALGAISAALAVVVKSPFFGRPLRWLWSVNVAHPVGDWNAKIVGKVVDDRVEHLMTHNNGGSSLKDLSDAVEVIQIQVHTLLEHDAERDTEGMRYGRSTPQEGTL